MRSRIGRIVRSNIMSRPQGTLGITIDWSSVLNQVAQAAPAVIAAVSKPASTTSGGTTYTAAPVPTKKKDYTPYYIGGGLLLAAGLAYVATKKK